MCLAIPALIKKIEGSYADVDIGGVIRRISLRMTPEAGIGDYVLLHSGFALNVIDPREAAETIKLLNQMAEIETRPGF